MTPKRLSNYGDSKIKKRDLVTAFLHNSHDWAHNKIACHHAAASIIFNYLGMNLHDEEKKEILVLVSILRSDFQRKYARYKGHRKIFFKEHSSWLESYFRLPSKYLIHKLSASAPIIKHSKISRKTKTFEELSGRSKRLKLSLLSQKQLNQSEKEIILTASKTMKIRNGGKSDISSLLESVSSPSKVTYVVEKLKQPDLIPFSPQEALNFFLEKRMTYDLYTSLKKQCKARGADIYPSYRLLSLEREECRPPKDSILIEEFSATVSTEELLHNTARRIIILQEEVILTVIQNRKGELKLNLICSWGCDGSSAHSYYKQKSSSSVSSVDESNIFSTTMTPLRLVAVVGKNKKEIVIWNNVLPQSYRSCRPMKIQYKKESKELILEEIERVRKDIDKLTDLEILLTNGRKVVVSFTMKLTVIDGKVLATIQQVPPMCCPLCHSKPKDFNIKDNVENGLFEPVESSLVHGASSLHARIRFMECLLHVGYRLEVKKWRISDLEDKEKVKARKKVIQDSFKTLLNLRIDFPNPGGAGSSNDGNTARTFFKNFKTSAHILGIEEEVVLRFSIILTAINCQLPLNAQEFGKYCIDTNNLFIDLYGWYKIPSSVHKILVHSEAIIISSILPLGMLSEEGAESRHKYLRNDRLLHARKNSRINAMADVFLRALDTSDPLIAALAARSRKNLGNRNPLPSQVIGFLIEPHISPPASQESSQSSSVSNSSERALGESHSDDLESYIDQLADATVLECEEFD